MNTDLESSSGLARLAWLATIAMAIATMISGHAHGQIVIGEDSGAGHNGGAVATCTNTVVIGTNAGQGATGVNNNNNTFIGTEAGQNTTGIGNSAIGYQSGIGVTGDYNSANGKRSGINVTGSRNSANGFDSGHDVTGDSNVGLGSSSGTAVNGSSNVAIGHNAGNGVTANETVSLGSSARASGNSAIAVGTGAVAAGAQSISIGTGNVVAADRAGAIGDPNVVSATGAYVVGNDNTVTATGTNSFVLGNNVTVTNANNVVLGNASTDRAAAQVTNATVTNNAGGAFAVSGFAGTAAGVTSIGSVGAERQVVNVAPGAINATSTDAVNGSQLHAVATGLNNVTTNLGTSLTTVIGGNTTYDPSTGVITGGIQIGNATYNSLSQAFSAVTQPGVRYDTYVDGSTNYESVTLNPGGNPSTIHNLAPGVADTDAVNVSQLNQLGNRLERQNRMLSGGIAATAAMAVVTPVEPGRSHVSGSVAGYNGQIGIGFNVMKRSENGQTTIHGGVGWGSGGGKGVVRIGFGRSF